MLIIEGHFVWEVYSSAMRFSNLLFKEIKFELQPEVSLMQSELKPSAALTLIFKTLKVKVI